MNNMFQRGLLLLALTIGLVFHAAAQSTRMTIFMNNGTERIYFMEGDDRMYFEDNETLVVEIAVNAKSDRFSLAEIRKITCDETEGVSETSETKVYLVPNPVHDAMTLRNLDGHQTVMIYALDGRLVKSFEVDGNQLIDIHDLSIGLYFVKTQRQTLKMIKL